MMNMNEEFSPEQAEVEEPIAASETTVAALKAKVDRLYAIKLERAELTQQENVLKEEKAQIEAEVIKMLEAGELDSFKGAVGFAYLQRHENYQTPKTLADREALGRYIASLGKERYYDLMTVNSQKLQSFAQEEMNAAAERGVLDFKIPGLGTPTLSTRLNVKKK